MSETKSSSLNSLTDILSDLSSAASDSHESNLIEQHESSGLSILKNGCGEKRRFSDFQPDKLNNSHAFLTRSLSVNDDNDQVITQFLASFCDGDVFLRGVSRSFQYSMVLFVGGSQAVGPEASESGGTRDPHAGAGAPAEGAGREPRQAIRHDRAHHPGRTDAGDRPVLVDIEPEEFGGLAGGRRESARDSGDYATGFTDLA